MLFLSIYVILVSAALAYTYVQLLETRRELERKIEENQDQEHLIDFKNETLEILMDYHSRDVQGLQWERDAALKNLEMILQD
jgi:hypothetical protein